MIVPVIKKTTGPKQIFVERTLPKEGSIKVKKGTSVEPFNRLGECMYVQNEMRFEKGFKPEKFRGEKKYIRSGFLIGKIRKRKIKSPYNGNLIKNNDGTYSFLEEERRFPLLSGVWGEVRDIYENRSVLIETQIRDMLFSASTDVLTSGELVVLPNPSDILKKSYLEKFAKGIKGKIVYIGHHVDEDLVKRAHNLGATAVIAGSSSRQTFVYAKKGGIGLGLISGFGTIDTPRATFELLESISHRYVFFNGSQNILRIPVPDDNIQTISEEDISDNVPFKQLKEGMEVWVLEEPNFGKIGTVDRISQSSILVKFSKNIKIQEVRVPNFFLFEE